MNPNPALAHAGAVACPLEFAGATRARLPLPVNGDAFVIERFRGGALVAVFDGMGHGERAYRATEVAVRCLRSHPEEPLDVLFRAVAKACRSTDGVFLAAARFEFANRITFQFASIGNIESRLCVPASMPDRPPKMETLIVRRGTLGGSAPDPYVTSHVWVPGSVLILHSDGVVARWGIVEFRETRFDTAADMAQAMLDRLAIENDDATLVVVREMPHL